MVIPATVLERCRRFKSTQLPKSDMFWQKALEAIGNTAQDPLALAMFVVLVVSRLVVALRVRRYRDLLHNLEKLPEKDRLKALEHETGPLPKKGINAEQWLRARQQTYRLAGFGIFCVMLIIIGAFAVFYYLNADQSLPVGGKVYLDDVPLPQATISVLGQTGQWQTDTNGAFQFQLPNMNADSLTFSISHTTDSEPLRLDTTVAIAALTSLRFDLKTTKRSALAGQVVEEGTGRPITGAGLMVAPDRGSGRTDSLGYFHFEVQGHPFERIDVSVSHPDYENKTVGLVLTDNQRILLRRKR